VSFIILGNLEPEGIEYVDGAALKPPRLTSAYYETGRGGSGNVMKNDFSANDRLAQDVDDDGPVLERPGSVTAGEIGRGGLGNIKAAQAEGKHELVEGKRSTSQIANRNPGTNGHATAQDEEPTTDLRGWADKGKDLLFGRKKAKDAA